ncbi:glycosyltransferase family 4 protein [bacterium]|nr:glycosyltransferase family 4 protein [bacterium]
MASSNKILIISTDLPPIIGGITKYVENITLALRDRYDIDFLGIPLDGNLMDPFFMQREVDIIKLKRNKFLEIFQMRSCFKKLALEKYHRIILANTLPDFFIVHPLLKSYKEKVYFLHYNNKQLLRSKKSFQHAIKDFHNICISDWLTLEFRDRGISNVETLYPMLDTKEFLAIKPKVIKELTKLTGFKLLTVSRIVPHKGHRDVISALESLDIAVEFIIAGSGSYLNELKSFAAGSPISERIHFTGRVDANELAWLYGNCDLFIMTSRNMPANIEGFGYSFIEANLHKKAVIGTDVGGIPSAVKDGVSGILLPEGNIERLADTIRQLYLDADLRHQLGLQGYERACKKFDIHSGHSTLRQVFGL